MIRHYCDECGARIEVLIESSEDASDYMMDVKNQVITHRSIEETQYAENKGECPLCGFELWECDNPNYCGWCGQKLNWEIKEEKQ